MSSSSFTHQKQPASSVLYVFSEISYAGTQIFKMEIKRIAHLTPDTILLSTITTISNQALLARTD